MIKSRALLPVPCSNGLTAFVISLVSSFYAGYSDKLCAIRAVNVAEFYQHRLVSCFVVTYLIFQNGPAFGRCAVRTDGEDLRHP